MGRIKRKRTPEQKRKKKQSLKSNASLTENKGESKLKKKILPFTSDSSDVKQKKAVLQTKASDNKGLPAVKQKDNYLTRAVQFFREVKSELKKVIWPSRKNTLTFTAVMIVLVVIISVFLGLVDLGLSGLIRVILN